MRECLGAWGRALKQPDYGSCFIEDMEAFNHKSLLQKLRGIDVLILHNPLDQVVSINNAAENFALLKHPKSFVSLAGADWRRRTSICATHWGSSERELRVLWARTRRFTRF